MSNKNLITIIVAAATLAGCVYAGRVEYTDDVLSGMSESKYLYIHDRLGSSATPEAVVKEYTSHQKFYDSKDY